MRALYDSIVKPKASLEFDYYNCLNVSANDVEQLVLRIDQWAGPYDVHAKGVTITVKRLKKEGSDFNSKATYQSIDSFLSQEPGQSAALDSVGIIYSLLHENVSTGVLENLEAEMTIENLVRPGGLAFMDGNRVVHRGVPPFRLIVNYTDYVVAKAFQALFEDWLASLTEFTVATESSILRSLSTYGPDEILSLGYQSVKAFPIVSSLAASFGLLGLLWTTPLSTYLFFVFVVSVYLFSDLLFRFIVSRFKHKPVPGPPFVTINKGDEKRRLDYEKKVIERRKLLRREAWTISSAFFTSVTSGLVLHYALSINN